MWFLAYSILPGATVTDEEILSIRRVPFVPPPEFVDTGGFEMIDQPGSETIRLIFLEADQRWVLACMPFEPPESETPQFPLSVAVLSPVD